MNRYICRLLSLLSLLALSLGTLLVAGLVAAPAASAATCQSGDVVLIDSVFKPNPVQAGASGFENDVTLTNCTSSTQSVTYGGTITAPEQCGGNVFPFGPISKTLDPNEVATYTTPIEPAPSCEGQYTQKIHVDQNGTRLDSETSYFTVQ